MRKKLVPAVGILALAAGKVSAQLVYEPFDYGSASVGTNLANTSVATPNPFTGYINPMVGQPWFDTNTNIGTGTQYEILVNSGNLTPSYTTDLAPATGNSATFTVASTASRGARLAISPTTFTSGSVYYSMTLRINDLTNMAVGGAGGFFTGLNTDVGTTTANVGTVGARLHLRRDTSDSSKFNIGIKSNTNTNTLGITYDYLADTNSASGAAIFNAGDSIFVVGSYTYGAGAGDDVSALWINPTSTSFGAGTAPARGAGVSGFTDMSVASGNDGNFDSTGVGSLFLRQGNLLIPQNFEVDEVRVDTTWAGVTAPKGTTWVGTSGASWSTGSNWDTAIAPNGAAKFVNFGAGGGTVNIDAPQTVGTLNIKSTTAYDLTGSTLTLNGDAGGQGNINVHPVMDAVGGPPSGTALASSHSISAPVDLATNSAMNIGLNQTLTVNSVISGAGTSLTKNGAGTLVLTASNTFTGGLKIGNGIVQASSDANLGGAGGGIILARGRLQATADLNIDAARTIQIAGPGNTVNVGIIDTNGFNVSIPGTIIGTSFSTFTNAGSLTKVGQGTLTLSGANTHTGNFVSGGTLAINDDSNYGTIPVNPNTNIVLSNGAPIRFLSATAVPHPNRVLNMGTGGGGTIDTNGFDATLTQRIFGPGGLNKRGLGTLTLAPTGTNSDYQGRTTVSGGILEAGASNAIGNDTAANGITLNGGTFRATGSFASVNRGIIVNAVGGTIDTQANTLTFGGNLTGTGALTKLGAGEMIVNTIDTGSLNVTAGRLVVTPRTGVPTLAASVKAAYVNGTISVDPTAGLDLKDHDLVVTFGTGPNSFGDILAQVLAGFGNPTGGITSSTSDGTQILALFDNSLVGATEWPGGSLHTIDANSVVGKYTYFGDVNIDGQVTGDDYAVVDSNLDTDPPVGLEWLSGDANLDGIVTGDDYATIDSNLGLGTSNPLTPSALSGAAAVPEPASVGVLVLGAAGLLGRRRRSR